mmetsp:Transcript_35858/g.94230  ORF Transcript_35858/g.94230 Transcript_35858/m.94230 type:complete len:224 (-) Transcript_35858:466-1137(-)
MGIVAFGEHASEPGRVPPVASVHGGEGLLGGYGRVGGGAHGLCRWRRRQQLRERRMLPKEDHLAGVDVEVRGDEHEGAGDDELVHGAGGAQEDLDGAEGIELRRKLAQLLVRALRLLEHRILGRDQQRLEDWLHERPVALERRLRHGVGATGAAGGGHGAAHGQFDRVIPRVAQHHQHRRCDRAARLRQRECVLARADDAVVALARVADSTNDLELAGHGVEE